MKTLYLCGAGNPEGVRLAIRINEATGRWHRLVILDDDPAKHGQSMLGIEIAGSFAELAQAEPDSEVANMVAKTTAARRAAGRKIQAYGHPLVTLIDPSVDTAGVEYTGDISIYQNVTFCAAASVGAGSVAFTGSVVGHGCRMGPDCILAPGAVINARVELGEGVYVGSNASILPDLKIGAWATIGANSSVVQDVPPGATVIGVPAQVIMSRSEEPGPPQLPAASEGRSDGQGPGARPAPGEKLQGRRGEALERLRLAQQKFVMSKRSRPAP